MRSRSLAPRTLALLALGFLAAACTDNDGKRSTPGPGPGPGPVDPEVPPVTGPTDTLIPVDLDSDGDGDLIVGLPSTVDPLITAVFERYTAITAPGGGRIHLLAQAGVPDAKLRRAREVLRQHLTDVPGTTQGASKADVADTMAAWRATLMLFRDQASGNPNDPAIAAFVAAMGESTVPLLADRCIVEGSPEYVATLPAEDNTFGVSAALVHRVGFYRARRTHFDALVGLANARLASNAFTAPASAPAAELDDAFVVVALDVHSGVFGHGPRPDGRGGNEFLYAFDSRPDMAAGDPELLAWIEAFFAPEHRFLALLDPTFPGTFDGLYRETTPYSNRAQYLRNMELTGAENSRLRGAPGDKSMRGNSGNNQLKGRAGNDLIVGGDGFDLALYSGPLANYVITVQGNQVIVDDVHGGHEGRDVLEGIERLDFTDQSIDL
jgi:hypothetical protein